MANDMFGAKQDYLKANELYKNKQYDEAFRLYERAAKAGYDPAQVSLGYCYEAGHGVEKKPEQAVYWYEQAAAQGNANAQVNLGYCFESAIGTKKDYKKAVYWYEKSAAQGNLRAITNLGFCYEMGNGVSEDKQKAASLYRQAAEQGYAVAQVNLGFFLDKGIGTEMDPAEAAQWYRKAADQGNLRAMCRLGLCYESGRGVAMDKAMAVTMYQKAAESGYEFAQTNLGYCYEVGIGTRKDLEKAVYWYQKAAEKGHARAITNLGVCYEFGRGITKDTKKAFELYQKAADKDYSVAQTNLGYCYEYGIGIDKDEELAVYWYQRAADDGQARGQTNLGNCYYNGKGVGKNYKKAVHWYLKAAEQNYAAALNNLGVCYESGNGVTEDKQKALEYYRRARDEGHEAARGRYERLKKSLGVEDLDPRQAEKMYQQANDVYNAEDYEKAFGMYLTCAKAGHVPAQHFTAWCYLNAKGTEKSEEMALYWYRKAAEKGYAPSQASVGYCYYQGLGTDVNYIEAVAWYEKAAEQNEPNAISNLGICYEYGNGVPMDKRKALELYKKAADMGLEEAKEYYKKLKWDLDGETETRQSTETDRTDHTTEERRSTEERTSTDRRTSQSTEQRTASGSAMTAQQEMDALIGLTTVKKEVAKIIKVAKYNEKRKSENKPVTPMSRHMVFTGNPGTGKTTVARIIAKLYYEMGLIQRPTVVEVDRADLVAEFVGGTATKTKKKIDEAMGGILFIDEAYTLIKPETPNDFGSEALDTLLKEMEDHRDEIIVIAAGYTKEMHKFISGNPGLKSRFKTFIEFPDYTAQELKAIFCQMAEKECYAIDPDADKVLNDCFMRMYRTRGKNFANGRAVRNLYEEILKTRVERAINMETDDDKIIPQDIPGYTDAPPENPEKKLSELIGLGNVKQEVNELIHLARYQKLCRDQGIESPTVSMHMVFTGNPGTGKTTVARLIAEIYYTIGVLPTNTFIEVDRSGLVGEYVGHTAQKTQEVIDQAIGGVLFIDEAYTLAKENANDFGHEAIEVILKAMEDNRENLVVIVAGYTEEMKQFIASNPGLTSRFTNQIRFDDYSAEELEGIFLLQAKNQVLTGEAHQELSRVVARISDSRTENFGNGRDIRNLYELILKKLAMRVSMDPERYRQQLNTIEAEDVLAAEEEYFEDEASKPRKKKPIGFHFDD